METAARTVRCREIRTTDLAEVLVLLQKGFPERSRDQLRRALDRQSAHAPPLGFPKYGYLLESNGNAVGVISVIFSSMTVDGELRVRGNVANWYVEPEFRSYAAMLTSRALGHKNVTFLNITPAAHTWPILEAQGYRRFSTGLFFAVAWLSPGSSRARIRNASAGVPAGEELSPSETDLLRDHASYGCLSLVCDSSTGRHPFVFAIRWTRWKSLPLPYALLVYCRDLTDFVRFSGPLGRFLALRGMPLVCIDSTGPIPGLIGKFVEWGPKFFKGPNRPTLGDLSYTEGVVFNP